MIEVDCKIISENCTKVGPMIYRHNDFSEEELLTWVYRNCPGCSEISIKPNVEVKAIFENRIEVYTMKTVKDRKDLLEGEN